MLKRTVGDKENGTGRNPSAAIVKGDAAPNRNGYGNLASLQMRHRGEVTRFLQPSRTILHDQAFSAETRPSAARRRDRDLAVVGGADDYEQEAHKVAQRVVPVSGMVHHKQGPLAADILSLPGRSHDLNRETVVWERPEGHAKSFFPELAGVDEVLSQPGRDLTSETRSALEPSFGQDFSRVRVHADAAASESAKSLNASAYTVGNHIVFGAGRYSPGSYPSDRLLAHELTHVVQQRKATNTAGIAPYLQRQADSPETEGLTEVANPPSTSASNPVNPIQYLFPPCQPARNLLQALTLHSSVSIALMAFLKKNGFGPETVRMWLLYLNPLLGMPRPRQRFMGGGEVVDGFTRHHKSKKAEEMIVHLAFVELRGQGYSQIPAPGTETMVPVTSLISPGTLHSRLNNEADPMGLNYDDPVHTIPGLLAGGIGEGGPPGNTAMDRDTRDVDGFLLLKLDSGGRNLTITPYLQFQVHDTVDFCPGALGEVEAQLVTVPMSVLEATENRYGRVFAADVPFDVTYPGPGISQSDAVPSPPGPKRPVAPPSPNTVGKREVRIGFKFDRPLGTKAAIEDSLDSDGIANLSSLITQLSNDPDLRVQLVGRASPEGPEGYNMALATRRVLMIAQVLEDAGISKSAIAPAPAGTLQAGCFAIATGEFSCGEIGAAGPADREVRATLFKPGTPPSPGGPGAGPTNEPAEQ